MTALTVGLVFFFVVWAVVTTLSESRRMFRFAVALSAVVGVVTAVLLRSGGLLD